MSYILELTPAAILFSLLAGLMVPYLGFLIAVVLLAAILAAIVATVLGLAVGGSLLLVRSAGRVRTRLASRRADRDSGAIETDLTSLGRRP